MEHIHATEKTEKTENYNESQEAEEETLKEENYSLLRYLWDEVNRGQVKINLMNIIFSKKSTAPKFCTVL